MKNDNKIDNNLPIHFCVCKRRKQKMRESNYREQQKESKDITDA